MTDALITDLSKIGALKVISRTSAMRYKGSEKPLPEIAREVGLHMLGLAYAEKGMYQEATAANQKAATVNPNWRWDLGLTYALAGRRDEARKIASESVRNPKRDPYGLTLVYAALGDKDQAFRWAEEAYRSRHPFTPWLKAAPFKPIHDDPRFQDLLRRMNLPPLERHAG